MSKNTAVLYQPNSTFDVLLSDLKMEATLEKGYKFLSRDLQPIPKDSDVVHLFMNLQTVSKSSHDAVTDFFLLHIIESNGVFYWDHTNFVTYLFDQLEEEEISRLSVHLFWEFADLIKPLLPKCSVMKEYLEAGLPIQIL